jgi:hypothetical protein
MENETYSFKGKLSLKSMLLYELQQNNFFVT